MDRSKDRSVVPRIEKTCTPSIARTVDPPYPPRRTRTVARPETRSAPGPLIDLSITGRTVARPKPRKRNPIPVSRRLPPLGLGLTLRLAPTAPRPSHPPPPPPAPAPTAAPDTAAVFSCVPFDADTRTRAIASWVHCAPAQTTRSRPHAPLWAGTTRPHHRHGPNPDRRPTGHQGAARAGYGFRLPGRTPQSRRYAGQRRRPPLPKPPARRPTARARARTPQHGTAPRSAPHGPLRHGTTGFDREARTGIGFRLRPASAISPIRRPRRSSAPSHVAGRNG